MERKAIPATNTVTKVQKKLSSSDSNKRALRSIVLKALDEEGSKAILDDVLFKDVKGTIEPPYHMLTLCMLRENSTELGQCVDAMMTNIDGFGYRLVEVFKTDEEKEKYKDEILKEKAELRAFLDNINFSDDITSLRIETRKDIEECGNAYWEFIPYKNKSGISAVKRIEAHTVRLMPIDCEPQNINMYYFNMYTKQIESKPIAHRFRKFIQRVGSQTVYFKEWGDPRNINCETGKEIKPEELDKAKKEGKVAHALYHFKIKSNRTPYGIPRYIGNLFSLYGSRGAEEINFITFQNNNIPSMMVLVSNGQLTQASIDRTQEFIETKIKGSNNRSSFLILEAEPADEAQINPGTMKMEIKDLSSAQKEDQLFQNYDKNNSEKIRRCFRLPPIFVGKSEDYNRATAQESRKLADEQVFSPLRQDFDKTMNRILVTEFKMKYHCFKSNSANVTNDEDLVKILSSAEKTGGVTPNLARGILSDILNIELPLYNEEKIDFDPNIPMSLTIVERAKKVAGNQQTGAIAPTQGQIPLNSSNDVEVLHILKNALSEEIYNDIFKDVE